MLGSAPTVAIVGGGASGVIAAVNLLALSAQPPPNIVIFERSGRVGAGTAFSTDRRSHLLNVPAGGMSAYVERQDDFVRWLEHQQRCLFSAEAFVERRLYRRYLRDALTSQSGRSPGSVDVVPAEVGDIEPIASGARVLCNWGRPLQADVVVLALGLLAPRCPAGLIGPEARSRFIANPWEAGALAGVAPTSTVALLGTGLTAVDVLLALREQGHTGPVHAISRHGLLPQVHEVAGCPSAPVAELAERVTSDRTRELVRLCRQAVHAAGELGSGWREVVDILRGRAQQIWLGLDDEEKARFRRHAERYWNIHRHRMAPQVGHELDRLRDAGVFNVHAGRALWVRTNGDELELEVGLRNSGRSYRWRADWVVNCTGPDPDVSGGAQPLLNRLRSRGLVQPGTLGMGLATELSGRIVDVAGKPVDWLWALGSLRQGQLFESTAVSEIRAQARQLAVQILDALNHPAHVLRHAGHDLAVSAEPAQLPAKEISPCQSRTTSSSAAGL